MLALDLRLEEDVGSVGEPHLPVVILEKVGIHLQDFHLMDLLDVEADFQHHAEAVVFRPQEFQLGLDHLIKLEVGELAMGCLVFSNEILVVVLANLLKVVLKTQSLFIFKLFVACIDGFFDVALPQVVDLHFEFDRDVSPQASLGLNTALHALKGPPLATRSFLSHHFQKLRFVGNFDKGCPHSVLCLGAHCEVTKLRDGALCFIKDRCLVIKTGVVLLVPVYRHGRRVNFKSENCHVHHRCLFLSLRGL